MLRVGDARDMLAGALVLALLPAVASAQPADPDADARRLFEAARVAYGQARYDAALQLFREAYVASPRPELLYNIGSAAERVGRDEEALDAFESFVRARPDAPERPQAEARIEVLRRSIASRPPPTGQSEPEGSPGAQEEREAPGGGGRLWTWVAGGTALAAAGAAAVLWLLARDAEDDIAAGCGGTRSCTPEEIEDSGGPTYVSLTNVSLVLSGIAAAGTVVLFLVEGDESHEEVTASVGVGAVAMRVRF